jgi:hypothetical protein
METTTPYSAGKPSYPKLSEGRVAKLRGDVKPRSCREVPVPGDARDAGEPRADEGNRLLRFLTRLTTKQLTLTIGHLLPVQQDPLPDKRLH